VPLGAVGLEHVRTRLRRFESADPERYPGGYPLRGALSRVLRGEGVVWTWAPPGWRPTLEDLRDASLPARVSQPHHRDLLFAFVQTFLRTPGHLMVIEDHDAGPHDRWLLQQPRLPHWLAFGKHVYWYATPDDRRLVRKVLNWGMGLFKCAVLADIPQVWTPNDRLTRRQVEHVAQSAEHVVVDAFDFEGTVVWSRRVSGLRLLIRRETDTKERC
jgi:hypothetical protein